MTVLSVIKDAIVLCGFDEPTSVVGNTDLTVRQCLAHLKAEGTMLAKKAGWRGLKAKGTITGDGVTTLFDLPADFDRYAPGRKMWEALGISPNFRHLSDEEFQAAQASQIFLLRKVWRIFGDQVEFYPALDDGQVVTFEYRTTKWVTDTNGVPLGDITTDSDLFLLPEEVLKLGVIWRFKSAKGFTFDQDKINYEEAKFQFINDEQPPRDIRISSSVLNAGLMSGVVSDVPNLSG